MIKPPILEKGYYSVLAAELSTGIILKTDFRRHIGKGDIFIVFKNYENAINYIKNSILDNSNLEMNLYNYKGEFQSTIDINGKK